MTGTGMNGLPSGCSRRVGHLISFSRLERSVPISTPSALRIDLRGHFSCCSANQARCPGDSASSWKRSGRKASDQRFHPARVELAPPRLDALDRGAEMGAVADGERGDTLGPRERRGQCDRAADRFADEMEALQRRRRRRRRNRSSTSRSSDQAKSGRRNVRAPATAHVERDQPVGIGERQAASPPRSRRWRRSRDETGSHRGRVPRRHLVDHVVSASVPCFVSSRAACFIRHGCRRPG